MKHGQKQPVQDSNHQTPNTHVIDNIEEKTLLHEESMNCWCCPSIEEYEHGTLIIHNESH